MAHEALTRLDGVKTVSERCDPENWTGTIELREGVLPDLGDWSRDFQSVVRRTFALRGVEVTVEGDVSRAEGRPVFHLSQGGLIRLAPLEGKIQWDSDHKRERSATADERTAHARLSALLAKSKAPLTQVRITGLLEAATRRGGPPTLHVREFLGKP